MDLVPVVLASVSGFIGLAALLGGWGFGNTILQRTSEGFLAMVPTTGLCFCLLSAAMVLGWTRDGGWRARTAYAAVFVTIGLVLINLLIAIIAHAPGIDAIMLGDRVGEDHMAVATAIGLLMAAYCILALMAPDNPDPDGPTYFAVAGLSTSFCVFAGHAVDSSMVYDFAGFHGMSVNAALAFCCLFASVLVFPHDRTGQASFPG